jgi:hypothetical protein
MVRSLAILLVALGTACGTKSEKATATAGDTLTERQRDSMLSTSRIPGARGVGAAMRYADSTSAGIHAADTISP